MTLRVFHYSHNLKGRRKKGEVFEITFGPLVHKNTLTNYIFVFWQ